MLIKFIACKTEIPHSLSFSDKQSQWGDVAQARGFLGQIGGWNVQDPHEACIVGFWQDEDSYQQFMGELHDQIVSRINQQETYRSISVTLHEQIMSIEGEQPSLLAALQSAQFFHLSLPVSHTEIRQSAIANTPGLVFGLVSQKKHTSEYAMLSFWNNSLSHQDFATQLPAENQGRVVHMVDSWSVYPMP